MGKMERMNIIIIIIISHTTIDVTNNNCYNNKMFMCKDCDFMFAVFGMIDCINFICLCVYLIILLVYANMGNNYCLNDKIDLSNVQFVQCWYNKNNTNNTTSSNKCSWFEFIINSTRMRCMHA